MSLSSSSTSSTPPPRSQRGRVATLGLTGKVSIDRFLVQPSIKVESLFDLLGAMTAATAQQPISAVLIDPDWLTTADASDSARAALRAVRTVDPAVRIVLFNTEQSTLDPSMAQELDDILQLPLTTDALGKAFDGVVTVRAEPLSEQPPIPRPVDTLDRPSEQPAVATTSPSLPEDLVSVSADDLPAPAETDGEYAIKPDAPSQTQPALPRKPTPDRTPSSASTQSARLGDVDLVESVLRHDGSLATAAAELISQQTGWTDVQICHIEPAGGVFESIVHGAQPIGWLRCDEAGRAQLRKWADWLARWLMLDHEHRRFRRLAFIDDLTGAWNRRYFMNYMKQMIAQARQLRIPISIMMFDLDNFKQFNDQHGHIAGDDILIETVRLLQSVIRSCDKVCRIGGDEFVVIFADLTGPREDGSNHPATVESIARRFQDQVAQMRFPKLGSDAPGMLTISAGLANFPWDSSDPAALLELADQRALESKRVGKNVITFGSPD